MSALPSSSSCLMMQGKREYRYGIFLSFNGKDTRQSFTDHLHSALTRQGIKTFRDDKSLERGEDFAPELLRAIGESWGSIIVISEGYAFSHWCLEELVEIMKQRKDRGHRVYPIFYHVEPSDFRHQRNSVKEAFKKHEKRYNKNTLQQWRAALENVTAISGWPLKDQYESAFIEDIVNNVSKSLDAEILVEQEVEKMKSTFQTIQALLTDAENNQYMKQGEVAKVWLDKLKRIAYNIDDVLDEWNTALLKSKIEEDRGQIHSTSSYSQSGVSNILPRIKELNETYQAIVKEKDDFHFALSSSNSCTDLTPHRPKTISLIDESDVYGRDHDKDAIVRLLLRGENSNGIPLIAIVGMGGLGKTTLAQLAYNSDEVKCHFPQRIWVCVSDPFDEVKIAKAILETLKGKPSSFNELESLLQEIRRNIKGKKFLLVLDDVWAEDEKKWKLLKLSLSVGSQESKILVTTRKEKVARIMGCPRPFLLGVLPSEDSWSLFSKIAFSERSNEDRENLESIGKKFVKKCAGLPLAIKTLAVLLHFKETKEQWQRILVSEMWKLEDEVLENLYAPLLLSYYDLPMSLKQCLCYCAIFPKDHLIERDELIKLWMAQGFLGETSKPNDLECIGEEYFNYLAMRCFFQQFEKDVVYGSIIRCKMHDIVHDFTQFLTKTECVLAVHKRVESSHENVQHLTLINPPYDLVPLPEPMKKLRSCHVLFSYPPTSFPSLSNLFHQLTNLRILSFHFQETYSLEIPKEIGKLIHLRYLRLEGNKGELPETLCDLCNLQTLNIRRCYGLRKLPSGMGKLINLRHLRNAETHSVTFLPKGLQRLTHLQTLERFVVVGRGEGIESETTFSLADLGKLIHLRGSLTIVGLGNVGEASEVREARLSTKVGLRELSLSFDGGEDKGQQISIEDEAIVLQALQPPQHLQFLWIYWCKGPEFPFPNWMTSLTLLKKVVLTECYNWESLPPMGMLASLESLYIRGMGKVKKVGEEFMGVETSTSSVNHNVTFPNLKTLTFMVLFQWEEWEYEDEASSSSSSTSSNTTISMPKLQSLTIGFCPELKMLPHNLLREDTPLQQLEIKSCQMLERRYNRETGEDWPSISHIPTVIFSTH